MEMLSGLPVVCPGQPARYQGVCGCATCDQDVCWFRHGTHRLEHGALPILNLILTLFLAAALTEIFFTRNLKALRFPPEDPQILRPRNHLKPRRTWLLRQGVARPKSRWTPSGAGPLQDPSGWMQRILCEADYLWFSLLDLVPLPL